MFKPKEYLLPEEILEIEKRLAQSIGYFYHGKIGERIFFWPPNGGDYGPPPNFLSELDAINKIECSLSDEHREAYNNNLNYINKYSWMVTANQRAQILYHIITKADINGFEQ